MFYIAVNWEKTITTYAGEALYFLGRHFVSKRYYDDTCYAPVSGLSFFLTIAHLFESFPSITQEFRRRTEIGMLCLCLCCLCDYFNSICTLFLFIPFGFILVFQSSNSLIIFCIDSGIGPLLVIIFCNESGIDPCNESGILGPLGTISTFVT